MKSPIDPSLFDQAKREALNIMEHAHDPYHDDLHVQEVLATAEQIIQTLPPRIKRTVDRSLLELVCLFHDTSRKHIRSNLILSTLSDDIISANMAYRILIRIGFPKQYARRVRRIIIARGFIIRNIPKKVDIHTKILTDADLVNVFSPVRFERGLQRFESKKFSRRLFNMYAMGCFYMYKRVSKKFHYEKTREIFSVYSKQMLHFFINEDERMKNILYTPVYRRLQAMINTAKM